MFSASASKSNESSPNIVSSLVAEEEGEGDDGEYRSCDGWLVRGLGLIMVGILPGLRRGGRGDGRITCFKY